MRRVFYTFQYISSKLILLCWRGFEYAKYIPRKSVRLHSLKKNNRCPGDDIKLTLMVRSGICGIALLGTPMSTLTQPIKVQSMGKKDTEQKNS